MNRLTRYCSVVALTAVLGACASNEPVKPMQPAADARAQALEAELSAARAERARLAAENARLETTLSTRVSAPAPAMNLGNSLLPPNAKAGECYSRVTIPAKYTTETEKVLKSAASEKLEVIPAKYEWVEETVLVTPASEKIAEVIPAQYRTVEERVMVKPASETTVVVPATYRTETTQELVSPATTIWKTGGDGTANALGTRVGADGQIMCLVEVPAVYRTVTKKVVATPAKTKSVAVPAEYTTVKRQELVREAQIRKTTVPAVYKTVKVQKQVRAATTRATPIPAEYQTVTRQKKVSEATADWSRVVCEANASRELIQRIQTAVKKAGYNPGEVDGVLGPATLQAVRSYERANSLPIGSKGAVPYATLASLNVKL